MERRAHRALANSKCECHAFQSTSHEAGRQVSSTHRRFVPEGGIDASLSTRHLRVHELHHLVTDSAGFVVEDHCGQRFAQLVRNEVRYLKTSRRLRIGKCDVGERMVSRRLQLGDSATDPSTQVILLVADEIDVLVSSQGSCS